MQGIGMEKNVSYDFTTMGTAAGMGSDVACYWIGLWNFKGKEGLPKHKAEAKHWLTKAVNGS